MTTTDLTVNTPRMTRIFTERRHRLNLMNAGRTFMDHALGHLPVPDDGSRVHEQRDHSHFGIVALAVVPLFWEVYGSSSTGIDEKKVMRVFAGQVAVRIGLGDTVSERPAAFVNHRGEQFYAKACHLDGLANMWTTTVRSVTRNWLAIESARQELSRLFVADEHDRVRVEQAMRRVLTRSANQLQGAGVSAP